MSALVESLVPEAIKKLIPYQSARRIGGSGRLWLNANELEHGIVYPDTNAEYHRYPDFLPFDIASAYQDYSQTETPTLAVRGADEAIDLIIRTFCQPGKDKILICSPTYAMYEFCADSFSVETLDVPLLPPTFSLNVDEIAVKAHDVNVVFLCSPNNPTGNLIPEETIIQVLTQTKESALVVVDEAYIDFDMTNNIASLINRFPHLIVIRTLSKAFGLAAVRCGFILAEQTVMDYLKKLVPPYPMPDSSSHIVMQALSSEGLAIMRSGLKEIIAVRDEFVSAIQSLKWIESIYPSNTNFILIKTDSSVDVFKYLLGNGVVTRNQGHEPALTNCVRITIGCKETMREVANLLTQYTHVTKNSTEY
ncbi:histidinol-phosphate transaminase [Vibrio sp. DW001]|uniref:histidinol-phosphate transaminase n=1 Tax=Vibrio sp. DW001 TaxID=2912315 RepID=UPI0023AEAA79|nr:histidinol-phosphate transaminase [Vibrio sp. DW001]WED29723.1 histidinol-phosphate transaminase [Vibrio sp. DW001]